MAASRSLGTLTLDLIAKIGGFEQGMDRAARTSDRKGREISAAARKRAKETEEAWANVGTAIGAVFSSIAVGAMFQKFIAETKQAEQEQAQLQAVLKSTGNAAGYSQDRLNQMADAMQQSLGMAAGDVNSAQTVLLAFTNIVGEKLPAALQAAADHAARTGSTIQASAEIMGRALDVPSVGMASLQKQGFKFSESQIEVARELERTGKIAEAQQMVLDALNESYGGAAAAARDTFGGALTALQNTINDLLTGDSGSMAQMKASIEGLNSTLASEETRSAFQTLIGLMTDVATAAINATTHFINFGRFAGEALAQYVHGAADPVDRLDGMLSGARTELAALDKELARPRNFSAGGGYDSTEDLQKRAEMLRKQIKGFEQSRADLSRAANNITSVTGDPKKPDLKPRSPGIVNLKDGGKSGGRTGKSQAEKDAEAAEKSAAAYIRQLNEQLGKVNELTAAERVLYDLQMGKVQLTHAQKDIALGLAQEIDATKELEKQRARDLAAAQSQASAQRELNDTLAQYARALDGFGLSDREQQRLAGLTQINEKYTADLRRLDDDRRAAQFSGKWTAEAQKQYDDELLLIGEFQQKSIAAYGDYYDQLTAKQGDWALGAQRALLNYSDEASNVFAQTESLVSKAFGGMEDALVNFVTTGKLDFNSLANSIVADITRIIIKQQISNALGVGGAGGSGGSGGGLMSLIGTGIGMLGGTGMMASAASAIPGDSLDNFLALSGFATGGYTGRGGKYEPAGIVHRGEYVINSESTKRIGLGLLNRMNGYANGGYVDALRGSLPSPQAPQVPGGQQALVGVSPIYVTVQMPQGGGSRETALQFGRTVGRQIAVAQNRNG